MRANRDLNWRSIRKTKKKIIKSHVILFLQVSSDQSILCKIKKHPFPFIIKFPMFGRLLLGVLASVLGSLGHSLGMTLQKRAYLQLEHLNKPLYTDQQWLLGLLLYLFSTTIPPVLALSLLPVFVTAPLSALGLVANAVFARYILNSPFAHTDWMGTLLVTVGSCQVAGWGAIEEPLLELSELLALYRRTPYRVYLVMYVGLVVMGVGMEWGWRQRYRRLVEDRRHRIETEPLLGSDQNRRDETKVGHNRAEITAKYISGSLSAILSGLLCGQTLLLAKSGIGLLVLALGGGNWAQLGDPLAVAILVALVGTALANLYYIQHALKLCSTLTVVPLCYCSGSMSALVSSLVYFNQARLMTVWQISMVSVGILLLAIGVGFLSVNKSPVMEHRTSESTESTGSYLSLPEEEEQLITEEDNIIVLR